MRKHSTTILFSVLFLLSISVLALFAVFSFAGKEELDSIAMVSQNTALGRMLLPLSDAQEENDLGENGFLFSDYASGTDSVREPALIQDGAGRNPTASDLNDIAASRAEKTPENTVIFVGDSRTVGMATAEALYGDEDPCVYIGRSGEGYYWFIEDGQKEMARAIEHYPDVPVVFNLGVNDLYNIHSYINLYQSFVGIYPDTRFFFLSVNPVTKEAETVSNSDILSFNKQIRTAFPTQYLDCYSVMRKKGFECVDGLHYSEKTYCDIHDFVISELKKRGVL